MICPFRSQPPSLHYSLSPFVTSLSDHVHVGTEKPTWCGLGSWPVEWSNRPWKALPQTYCAITESSHS